MSRSSLSQFPAAIPARWQSIFLTRKAIASRRESAPDSAVESQFRRKPEFALASNHLRRFRPLFAAAQSTAASKLANPLKNIGFLVLRQTAG
jgi:hypothetical protein